MTRSKSFIAGFPASYSTLFSLSPACTTTPTKPIHEVPVPEAARLFITNAHSPMYVAETFFDRLKPRRHAGDHVVADGQLDARNHLRRRRVGNLSRQQGSSEHAGALLLSASPRRRTNAADHASWLGEDRHGRRGRAGRSRRPASRVSTPLCRNGAAAARKPMSTMKAMCCLGRPVAKSVTIIASASTLFRIGI